jgi:hypothetical protein
MAVESRFHLSRIVAAFFIPCVISLHPARAATAAEYYVSPTGSDSNAGTSAPAPFRTIQKAVNLAQPGDAINLAAGVYLQDVHSARNGTPNAPIIIRGPAEAVIKGGGDDHVVEINHDDITLQGFTVDGLWGDPASKAGYRDKLLYVHGAEIRAGVTGLRVLGVTLRNAGGECARLRYFVQRSEIANSIITHCGVADFVFNDGGMNGEGIYMGTAPEQLNDGKNPTNDPDLTTDNWIHGNFFDTRGNECVDIKEAATRNLVERNRCTGQKDPNSAGFDARGSGNVFRDNESYGNLGGGVRLGGDSATDGTHNDVYRNNLHDNAGGGIVFQRAPQARVCGNLLANNTGGDATGSYGSRYDPAMPCTSLNRFTYVPAVQH